MLTKCSAGTIILVLLSTLVPDICAQTCDADASCSTDFSQDNCDADDGEFYTPNVAANGCCPGCQEYTPMKQPCAPTMLPCAPGTTCEKNGKVTICTLNTASCFYTLQLKYLTKAQQAFVPPWRPKCNKDGTYAPVQCKGDIPSGRCFCTNPYGKRIFGWQWYRNAKDMTCACSMKRWELENKGRSDVTLHCNAAGGFEELQCDSGMCWCAEEHTGYPKLGVPVVPEGMMNRLPCYNATDVGISYLRQCESQAYAQALIRNALREHGTLEASIVSILCDYDGSFGRYQLRDGIAFCSWRDGKKIGSWQAESGTTLATLTCNCARDSQIFSLEDMTLSLTCDGNGNYRPQQEHNGLLYCVDSDGFAITELQELGEPIDCAKYLEYIATS